MAFTAVDLLAPVVAARAAALAAFDSLGVEGRLLGLGFASDGDADLAAKGIQDPLPGAVLFPGVEEAVGGGRFGQILGEHPPLTTGLVEVENGVEEEAEGNFPGAATLLGLRQQRFEQRPLFIRQIRLIHLVHKIHSW
jgi:hypothetical protein